jgi:AraC-like DNA-binding protein
MAPAQQDASHPRYATHTPHRPPLTTTQINLTDPFRAYDAVHLVGPCRWSLPRHVTIGVMTPLQSTTRVYSGYGLPHSDADLLEIRCFSRRLDPGVENGADFLYLRLPVSMIQSALGEDEVGSLEDLRCPPYTEDPVVGGIGVALLPALQRPEQVCPLFLDHAMTALGIHVARRYGRTRRTPHYKGGLSARQRNHVIELMKDREGGNLSIMEMAMSCGLSPSHFIRAFRISFGSTPHRWQRDQRLSEACKMLEDGTHAIADIAAMTGFSDQSHFTRIFSKTMGIPPARWRRERDT